MKRNVPPTCPLRWDHVDPERKQWFCGHCQHHVHNLSAMTRREAAKFIRSPSIGRPCVSFVQDDCGRPVFKTVVPWVGKIGASLTWLASAVFVLLGAGCATAPQKQ